jgi:hypothetical protein
MQRTNKASLFFVITSRSHFAPNNNTNLNKILVEKNGAKGPVFYFKIIRNDKDG